MKHTPEAIEQYLRIGAHLGYRYEQSPCWRIITQGKRYVGRFPLDELPAELDFGNRDMLAVLIVAVGDWRLMDMCPLRFPRGVRIRRSRVAADPWLCVITPHWKMEQLVWLGLGGPLADYYTANRKSHSLASAYIANRAVSDPAEFRAAWLHAADQVRRMARHMVRLWRWPEAARDWVP